MNKKKNNVYEAPVLTVVTFKIERGFAASQPVDQKTIFPVEDGNFDRQSYGTSQNDTWF
jgi:hypothetical protein